MLNKSIDSYNSNLDTFLDKLSPKIKKVYSRMNVYTSNLVVKNYSPQLINDTFNGSRNCKGLNSVLRWGSESFSWLEQKESNKNHVLSSQGITEEIRKNFPILNEKLDFFKIHELFVMHDIGEMGPGDRTHEEKLSSSLVELERSDKIEQRYGLMLIGKLDKYGVPSEKIKILQKMYLNYEEHKNDCGYLEENFVKFIDTLQGFLYVNFEMIDDHVLTFSNNEEIINKFKTSWLCVKESWQTLSKTLMQNGCSINILGDINIIDGFVKVGDKGGLKIYLRKTNPGIFEHIKI